MPSPHLCWLSTPLAGCSSRSLQQIHCTEQSSFLLAMAFTPGVRLPLPSPAAARQALACCSCDCPHSREEGDQLDPALLRVLSCISQLKQGSAVPSGFPSKAALTKQAGQEVLDHIQQPEQGRGKGKLILVLSPTDLPVGEAHWCLQTGKLTTQLQHRADPARGLRQAVLKRQAGLGSSLLPQPSLQTLCKQHNPRYRHCPVTLPSPRLWWRFLDVVPPTQAPTARGCLRSPDLLFQFQAQHCHFACQLLPSPTIT